MTTHIRGIARHDLRDVLVIENHSFEYPWSHKDFTSTLNNQGCGGMVFVSNGEILGYLIYLADKDTLGILNFAVHQAYRRQKVGAQLVQRLIDKLSQQRRKRIELEVNETNLAAQKFFRAQKFVAYQVVQGYYENGRDAYSMRYSLNAAEEIVPPQPPIYGRFL